MFMKYQGTINVDEKRTLMKNYLSIYHFIYFPYKILYCILIFSHLKQYVWNIVLKRDIHIQPIIGQKKQDQNFV